MTTTLPDIERNAELFRVLGHETRLRLLQLLAGGEHAVSEIDTVLAIGQPGLSQQLAILRNAGIVATRRVAKQVYYRLEPAALAGAAALVMQLAATGEAPTAAVSVKPKKPRSGGSSASFARML